jgi:pimeloyl-ACP methyl ester carboxylesterase
MARARAPLLSFLLLALLVPTLGCVSLKPFAEVRREVPPDQFVKVGNQLVHVEQAGTGEPVVLLHGFAESTYTWRKVIPALANSFHVVAIDFSGFGYTERPKAPAAYTRSGQEALVLGVLDALGIESAQLVGHSYGGGMTLYIASRHPERVRSMVLVDSSAPTYPNDRRSRLGSLHPVAAVAMRFLLRPKEVRKALAHTFYDPALATPEMAHAYLERLAVEGVGDAYHGLTVPTRDDYLVDLAQIHRPTLVVWGAEDTLVKLEDGRKASVTLGGRFEVIEKNGHVPMEENPGEFLRIVTPFLLENAAKR